MPCMHGVQKVLIMSASIYIPIKSTKITLLNLPKLAWNVTIKRAGVHGICDKLKVRGSRALHADISIARISISIDRIFNNELER